MAEKFIRMTADELRLMVDGPGTDETKKAAFTSTATSSY